MKRCILIMNLAIVVLIFGATSAYALECMAGESCDDVHHTYLSCTAGATCYGVMSKMDCDSGAQCYGIESQMSCDSGASCHNIGAGFQQPVCDMLTSWDCRLVEITEDIQKKINKEVMAIGQKASPTLDGCVLYYGTLGAGYNRINCYWDPNRVDVHKAVEIMNAAFHVTHFQCSLKKSQVVACVDGYVKDIFNLTMQLNR